MQPEYRISLYIGLCSIFTVICPSANDRLPGRDQPCMRHRASEAECLPLVSEAGF